jgi:hypothetical protein
VPCGTDFSQQPLSGSGRVGTGIIFTDRDPYGTGYLFQPNATLQVHVFGPPESGYGSIRQRYGSGSLPFLIKVLSGLK